MLYMFVYTFLWFTAHRKTGDGKRRHDNLLTL